VKVLRYSIFFLITFSCSGSWAQQPVSDAWSKATSESQPSDATSAKPAVPIPGLDPMTGLPFYKSIHENWKSLSVKGSEFRHEPPLVGQVDEQERFTRTLVALKWRPGDALDVYVIMPKGVTKPPAVLYLYNYMEETDRFRNNDWCDRVTMGGVAAVGFVSALSGHRFHDRPMKQWFVSELQESLGSTVHDVQFILDYLDSRGDIDMSRVGMFGQGSGGTIAILAAAADPRIKAIDVLEPWGDWPVWLAKSSVVQDDPDKDRYREKEFLKQVKPLDPVKWLPKLKSTKIRIQQISEYDDSVPTDCQNRIKKAAPKQAEVVRFDTTMQIASVEGGGRMWDWMRGALAKPRSPQNAGTTNTAADQPPAPSSAAVQNKP